MTNPIFGENEIALELARAALAATIAEDEKGFLELNEIALELAQMALDAAIAEDEERFLDLFTMIVGNFARHLGYVVWYWCRRYADHATDGMPPQKIKLDTEFTGLQFVESGDPDNPRYADDPRIPREVIWAGRITTAATLGDIVQYNALIEALPGGDQAISEIMHHLGTLVVCIAETIRRLPRGFGLTPSSEVNG